MEYIMHFLPTAVSDHLCPSYKLARRYQNGEVSYLEALGHRMGHSWRLLDGIYNGVTVVANAPYMLLPKNPKLHSTNKELWLEHASNVLRKIKTSARGILSPKTIAVEVYRQDRNSLIKTVAGSALCWMVILGVCFAAASVFKAK